MAGFFYILMACDVFCKKVCVCTYLLINFERDGGIAHTIEHCFSLGEGWIYAVFQFTHTH